MMSDRKSLHDNTTRKKIWARRQVKIRITRTMAAVTVAMVAINVVYACVP